MGSQKPLLTLDELKSFPKGEVFNSGFVVDSPEGVNMTGSGQTLRWVAVTGMACDWCIYVHHHTNSIDYVRHHGDKVCSKENILKLVNCTKEVLSVYRY